MSHSKLSIRGLVTLTCLFAPIAPSLAGEFALMVGVNECPQFQLPNGSQPRALRGAEADADSISTLLVDQYRWPAEQVQVLKGRLATRSAIEAAFRELTKKLSPADAFVFHFSGHGTQVSDRHPLDEPDNVDEAICPSDANAAGQNLILDDELGQWLEKLPCRNITVILDCCHSGTGIKELEDDVAPRFLTMPLAVQRLRSDVPSTAAWREIRGDAKSLDRQVTAYYACQAEQQAYERRLPEIKAPARVGQFSHFLVEALRQQHADADRDGIVTRREAIEYVTRRLNETFNRVREQRADRQEPVLESDSADGPLFRTY